MNILLSPCPHNSLFQNGDKYVTISDIIPLFPLRLRQDSGGQRPAEALA